MTAFFDPFHHFMQPSIAELCACYDTTAKEVTRRSVDIARMRKLGKFADGAMLQHQAENSDLHQHLEGVSVSMRWHVYEVFNQLHKIGQELTIQIACGQNLSVEDEPATAVPSADSQVLLDKESSPNQGAYYLKCSIRNSFFGAGYVRMVE